jgi:hypothetical protein
MKGKIAVTLRSLSQNGHPALDLWGNANYEIIFTTPGRQPNLEAQKIFFTTKCRTPRRGRADRNENFASMLRSKGYQSKQDWC